MLRCGGAAAEEPARGGRGALTWQLLGGRRAVAGVLRSDGWVRPAARGFVPLRGRRVPRHANQLLGFAHCTTTGLMSPREAPRRCTPTPIPDPGGRQEMPTPARAAVPLCAAPPPPRWKGFARAMGLSGFPSQPDGKEDL
jgi:hypothetical protein